MYLLNKLLYFVIILNLSVEHISLNDFRSWLQIKQTVNYKLNIRLLNFMAIRIFRLCLYIGCNYTDLYNLLNHILRLLYRGICILCAFKFDYNYSLKAHVYLGRIFQLNSSN